MAAADLAACALHVEPPELDVPFIWIHPTCTNGSNFTQGAYDQGDTQKLVKIWLYGRKQFVKVVHIDVIIEQLSMREHFCLLMEESDDSGDV